MGSVKGATVELSDVSVEVNGAGMATVVGARGAAVTVAIWLPVDTGVILYTGADSGKFTVIVFVIALEMFDVIAYSVGSEPIDSFRAKTLGEEFRRFFNGLVLGLSCSVGAIEELTTGTTSTTFLKGVACGDWRHAQLKCFTSPS